MMNEIQTFSNAQFGEIQSVTIDDMPYFVGKDVASVLGYSNTRSALATHGDAEDKITVAICDGSGNPSRVLINESGLYSLILTSKLPSAKEFKKWVTSSVLPMIRRTGIYAAGMALKSDDTVAPMRLLSPDDYLSAARLIATCRNERLAMVLALLSKGGWDIPMLAAGSAGRADTSDIGERITRVRQRTGMGLSDISRMSGISVEVLRSYETGRRFPKQERYTALVMLLNKLEEKNERKEDEQDDER